MGSSFFPAMEALSVSAVSGYAFKLRDKIAKEVHIMAPTLANSKKESLFQFFSYHNPVFFNNMRITAKK